VDKALGDTFLDPDLEYLLVPCLRVPQYILSTGFESELKGSLHSCCLFETIIRCSIVKFYNYKCSALVVFLQAGERGLQFQG